MTYWVNFKRYMRLNYLRLLRVKDQPEALARGIAFGFASGFGPFIGFGVFAAWAFAALFRGNRLAAVITALLFKWAIPIFVTSNIFVGSLIWGESVTFHGGHHHLFTLDFWRQTGAVFLTGSAIDSVAAYFLAYFPLLQWAQRRRAQRRVGKRVLQHHLE
ncbi:DUF2062 domain-containing protein [Heliobacillus mobilis]|uniref:DUF2062 domain-containing protein n=1 Tax=Heliobacterium mobile TaxID=28064 RepID=A0A6I3SKS4_HELMO|nr:DUF2062 domain-containing protein [Heliobacterium mobile]MTV49558.1 DUF2062 domain-containing protein [Heliobacterium mobile]